jgi:hypothetical protein
MRKALVALSMILIIAGLLAVSGCVRTGRIVNLNKMLMDGESWTYEGYEGGLIIFCEDGSFRFVGDEKAENGGYEVFQTDDGNRLELTFVDADGNAVRLEEWSAEGDIGTVDTVTDPQGQTYYLAGTRDSLRNPDL